MYLLLFPHVWTFRRCLTGGRHFCCSIFFFVHLSVESQITFVCNTATCRAKLCCTKKKKKKEGVPAREVSSKLTRVGTYHQWPPYIKCENREDVPTVMDLVETYKTLKNKQTNKNNLPSSLHHYSCCFSREVVNTQLSIFIDYLIEVSKTNYC